MGEISAALSTAAHSLSDPKPPDRHNHDIKKAEKYYNEMLQKRRDYDAAINYVIDEVLGLASNPTIQSYRLAGGRPVVKYNSDKYAQLWYIDIVDSKKDKPLKIIFSH